MATYGPSFYSTPEAAPAPQGPGIGQHLLRGGLAALGGGLGAYANYRGIQSQLQQQQEQQQAQQPPNTGAIGKSQFPTPMGPQQQVMPTQNEQLSNILERLTSQKIDDMRARRAQMSPQPEMLYSKAFDVANNQIGQSQPPQWNTGAQPSFAFDQFLGGGGAQYSPLSALADLATDVSGMESTEEQPWWRQAAHGVGGLLQGAAPLAGNLGPWGALAGLGLGGLGYGLKQI